MFRFTINPSISIETTFILKKIGRSKPSGTNILPNCKLAKAEITKTIAPFFVIIFISVLYFRNLNIITYIIIIARRSPHIF
jgi:hypothetical protein